MSHLLVETPASHSAERKYILSVLLGDRLGLEWNMVQTDRKNVRISHGDSSAELIISDEFFSTPIEHWYKKESLPTIPLQTFDTTQLFSGKHCFPKNILVLFGTEQRGAVKRKSSLTLPIDIFGSAFFLLTRYEEVVLSEETDAHGRFQASKTILGQSNYLHRPLEDEYESLLLESIKLLWPSIQHSESVFSLVVTHDVDVPFATKGCSVRKIARRLAGDLLIRKNPRLVSKRLASLVIPGKLGDALDPNNTFSWIMNQVENHGLKSAFNFMACRPNTHDTGYDIASNRVGRLMKAIDRRGHSIGFHPSYSSMNNEDKIELELESLKKALNYFEIQHEITGGRHHYLKWNAKISWDQWDALGLQYDSSVGFAETVGFRAGTCKPYRTWSFSKQCKLNLIERPLIIMDVTLLSTRYMDLKLESCKNTIDTLISTVKEFRGELVTLWHNDALLNPVAKEAFIYTLEQS